MTQAACQVLGLPIDSCEFVSGISKVMHQFPSCGNVTSLVLLGKFKLA
jgi:hypothetical protein